MKKLLALIGIVSLFLPFTAFADLSTGLVGYWPLDIRDGTSKGMAYDRSGNGNTGTLVGSPTPVAGKIGQALSFNGTSQYVNMGNVNDMSGTVSFSYGAWVKYTDDSENNYPGIVSKLDPSGIGYSLNIVAAGNPLGPNNPYCQVAQNYAAISPTAYNDNQWHLFTCTVDYGNSLMSLYVDGTLIATTTITTGDTSNSENFSVGRRYDGTGSNCFSGTIDDVRIYNRALSAAEVSQLYRSGVGVHQGSWEGSIISTIMGMF